MFNIALNETWKSNSSLFPAVAVWPAAESVEKRGRLGSRCCSDTFSLLAHRVATVSCCWSGGSGAVIIAVSVFQDSGKQFSAA